MLLASQGCMRDQVIVPDRSLEVAQRQTDALMRQARVETDAIRAEMAATRIAAAKQEAELGALRREILELRQVETQLRAANEEITRSNAEQQRAVEAKEAELTALRAEKERLGQTANELQVKPAELPHLRQAEADGSATRRKLQELESTVALLKVELAQVKKSLAGKKAVQPSAALPSPAEPLQSASALLLDAGQVLSIRVRPGDSLWGLALKYGVSLADLKSANRLRGDQINVGQRLVIPSVP